MALKSGVLLIGLSLCLWSCQGSGRLAHNSRELPSERRPLLVDFRGLPGLSARQTERALTGSLERYLESGWNEAFLDDARFVLKGLLIDQGYLQAEISSRVETHPAGRRVTFEVEPGAPLRLGRFSVVGLPEAIAADSRLVPSERLFEPDSAGGRRFSPLRLERAAEDLLAAMYAAGHLTASLREPLYAQTGEVVDVLLAVDAGPAQRLKSVQLHYALTPPEGAPSAEALQRIAREFRDQPDTATTQLALFSRLEALLAEAGFPEARWTSTQSVEPSVEAGVLWSNLSLSIEPGERVRILSYEISGLERTRRAFIERRLAPKPGQFYSPKAIDQSFRRLYRSGLFERVAIDLAPGPGEHRNLEVEVKEAPAREFFLEPGYGTFDGARLRAGFREQNLLGSGRGLRLEGLLAERAQKAEIGLTDPDFLGDSVLGDTSVGYERRERPAFTREGLTYAARISWPLHPDIQLTSEYRFAQTDLSQVALDPGADPELQAAFNEVDVASLLLAPAYDTRDRLFTPNRGVFARLGAEWASAVLGSEADFVRLTATANWYLAISEAPRSVLALSARAGWIAALGGTSSVPLQERFFLGGATSVRAFEEDRLGPKDGDGTPLGGNSAQMLSLEWRRQLAGALDAGLFYDLGAVDPAGALTIAPNLWEGGPGLGLRYLLPVGPLRLDLGYNQDPGPFDSTWVWALAVGMSF